MTCVALTLLCHHQSSCCAFLSNLKGPPSWMISWLVRWLSRIYGFLFSFKADPQKCQSHHNYFSFSLFFFFLCFTQLCREFLAPFGGLSSYASVQQIFCVNCSTYRCVFLMCLWEKLSTTSYSSAIFILLPRPLTISFGFKYLFHCYQCDDHG